MAFKIDPKYNAYQTFNKCTVNGYYRKDELIEKLPIEPDPCDDLPEQYIHVKLLGVDNIVRVDNFNGYEVEYYYWNGPTGGTLELGERLRRIDIIDGEGTLLERFWQDSEGNPIDSPDANSIVEEGRDAPISSEHVELSPSGTTALSVPSANVTYGTVQFLAPEEAISGATFGITEDSLYLSSMAEYTLDGTSPASGRSYLASHGTIVKLDSFSQCISFRAIAKEPPQNASTGIPPRIIVTYYIGTSRRGRI